MTSPGAATNNTADGNARVGLQTGAVHGDVNVYEMRDASPPEKYRTGVNYLSGGMLTEARKLIGEAIAMGHTNNEVWFHWLLALLGDKNLRQFATQDLHMLHAAQAHIPRQRDPWSEGTRTIFHLINTLRNPDADIDAPLS